MRVLVVDDHALLRDGLRLMLIDIFAGAEVIEAETAAQAEALSAGAVFDLAVLDWYLPDGAGGALALRLRSKQRDLAVVFLSALEHPADIASARRMGALGFIPKRYDASALRAALLAVAAGETVWPTAAPAVAASSAWSDGLPLTLRQKDVLRLLVEGLSNREIGQVLCVSEETVKTHLSVIYQTLGVTSRAQAISAIAALRQPA